tara:strand:- start:210 stop:323 length:114 start_codon:yes stop_codon:yes gene_type:complete
MSNKKDEAGLIEKIILITLAFGLYTITMWSLLTGGIA